MAYMLSGLELRRCLVYRTGFPGSHVARPYSKISRLETWPFFCACSRGTVVGGGNQWPSKVGINGFGRIGRNIMRAALGTSDLDFVAVNDLTNAATLAHLLKDDSILGNLHADIGARGTASPSTPTSSRCCRSKDPAQLPWKDLGVDVVFESTGLFTDREQPPSTSPPARRRSSSPRRPRSRTSRVVLGVNEDKYDPAKHHIISNASCTTNCLAPLAKVLHETFGITEGLDDDDPLLHERPAAARPAAQGSAARPRGGAVHHPDDHRRGARGRRSAARAEGTSSTASRCACRRRTCRSWTCGRSSTRRRRRRR